MLTVAYLGVGPCFLPLLDRPPNWYKENKCFLLLVNGKLVCALNCQICGYFFREGVLKIALARSIFQLKMYQLPFGGLLRSDPLGRLQHSLGPLAGLRVADF